MSHRNWYDGPEWGLVLHPVLSAPPRGPGLPHSLVLVRPVILADLWTLKLKLSCVSAWFLDQGWGFDGRSTAGISGRGEEVTVQVWFLFIIQTKRVFFFKKLSGWDREGLRGKGRGGQGSPVWLCVCVPVSIKPCLIGGDHHICGWHASRQTSGVKYS